MRKAYAIVLATMLASQSYAQTGDRLLDRYSSDMSACQQSYQRQMSTADRTLKGSAQQQMKNNLGEGFQKCNARATSSFEEKREFERRQQALRGKGR